MDYASAGIVLASCVCGYTLPPRAKNCTGLKTAGNGLCKMVYLPVCGNDGETYSNEYILNREKKNNPASKREHNGPCHGTTTPRYESFCTHVYAPVCGNDGETYINECIFELEQKINLALKKVHNGPCDDESQESASTETDADSDEANPPHEYFCTHAPFPVCGNDGKTYANECVMDKAKEKNPALKKVHNGPCYDFVQKEQQPSKLRVEYPGKENTILCKLTYSPVCANDGETYNNECLLNREMKKNLALEKEHDGPCHDNVQNVQKEPQWSNSRVEFPGPENSISCKLMYSPVCANDGETYNNECLLNRQMKKNPALKKEHDGPCHDYVQKEPQWSNFRIEFPVPENSILCKLTYSPVCANDGETYNNECLLNREIKKNPALKKEHDGPCHDNIQKEPQWSNSRVEFPGPENSILCKLTYSPVCANDGETYNNECLLNREIKKNPALKKEHDGPCHDNVQNFQKESQWSNSRVEFPGPDNSISCKLMYSPVCANDGETYNNECLLNREKKKNPALKKEHDGPCQDNVQKEPLWLNLRVEFPGAENTILCKLMYSPVCANDGETYNNECLLNREMKRNPDLKKEHDGPCANAVKKQSQRPHLRVEFPCISTLELHPICGTDGNTYPNLSALQCAKRKNPALEKKYDGECLDVDQIEPQWPDSDEHEDFIICSYNYFPVCANDGRTYRNQCFLHNAKKYILGLKKVHNGPCDDESREPASTESDTDSDESNPPHEHFCTHAPFRVCGNDGNTYANECVMDKAKEENPALKKVYNGPCQDYVQKEQQRSNLRAEFPGRENIDECKLMYLPVCANDGKTYGNECLLNREKMKNPDLEKEHDGPCADAAQKEPNLRSISCAFTLEHSPVCGTDGKTYGNLNILNCEQRKNPALEKKHLGPCHYKVQKEKSNSNVELSSHRKHICNMVFAPVCGNDGETYGNDCFLYREKMKNPALEMKYRGECLDKPRTRKNHNKAAQSH